MEKRVERGNRSTATRGREELKIEKDEENSEVTK